MKINTDQSKIEDILTKGVEEVIVKKDLREKLSSGKKLRVKHGIDPTGPRIHMGRAFQFWKLRAFQDLGHQIVLIIGDFTARIGDASDKDSIRKTLSVKEINQNMKSYIPQISKIIDMKKTEVRYNSEWLSKLKAEDIISLSMNFTAQQMIQRRNFKERWEEQKPIGLHELFYPILQGYDSVAIKSDLEIGGFDQLFNLKVGRELQVIFKQKPQDIMVSKMLPGLDGRKMSTSWGNIISIIDNANQIYGKVMSMQDEFILDYFELGTLFSLKEIKEINLDNPKEAKEKLAYEITRLYHGEKKASKAEKEFRQIFKDKKAPDTMPSVKIKEKQMDILELLKKTSLVGSKAEARRIIEQKGVKIDNQIQDDWQKIIEIKKDSIIQVGKRKFLKLL